MDLTQFFQLGPVVKPYMEGTYNISLVLLSYVIATMAAYVALDLAGRIRMTTNRIVQFCWLIGGAFAMGMGIWSMHFVGMLAFMMPMPMYFSPFLTILSMFIAIIASGFAFFMITGSRVNFLPTLAGGILLGIGIASMHYTGMAAMLDVEIRYIPSLFILSLVIAIGASEAALLLMLKSTRLKSYTILFKSFSALLMGFAVAGMHYMGMFAAIFYPKEEESHHLAIDPTDLSYSIVLTTIVIMVIALIASKLWGIILETKHKKLVETEKKLVVAARSAGMAEVATCMLHNVGNVLNSINISTQMLLYRNHNQQIETIAKLGEMLDKAGGIEEFVKKDPTGKYLSAYLKELSQYLFDEQNFFYTELKGLNAKVQHIKNIISTQQTLSKSGSILENVDINTLVDYAIVINVIEKSGVQVVRHYGTLPIINVDKVKLLQILINLTKNAMEAVLENGSEEKVITITTRADRDVITVEIKDNGVGIKSENLDKIFTYGFTTKKKGHGFGLHPSSLSAKEMGGDLQVFSDGPGKGAKFVLTIRIDQTSVVDEFVYQEGASKWN